MNEISYLAVLVGGLAFFVLGFIWYSFLFQKMWAADMGIELPTEPAKPPVGPLVGVLVIGLIIAYIVEFFVRDHDLGFGLCRGAIVGIAMAAANVMNGLFDPRPKRLMWINGGYVLVGSVIAGAVAALL